MVGSSACLYVVFHLDLLYLGWNLFWKCQTNVWSLYHDFDYVCLQDVTTHPYVATQHGVAMPHYVKKHLDLTTQTAIIIE